LKLIKPSYQFYSYVIWLLVDLNARRHPDSPNNTPGQTVDGNLSEKGMISSLSMSVLRHNKWKDDDKDSAATGNSSIIHPTLRPSSFSFNPLEDLALDDQLPILPIEKQSLTETSSTSDGGASTWSRNVGVKSQA
jgi:hypothetical protein